jgi:hypothetical protein
LNMQSPIALPSVKSSTSNQLLSNDNKVGTKPRFDDNGVLISLPSPGAYARWCLANEPNEFQTIGLFYRGELSKRILDGIFNEFSAGLRRTNAPLHRFQARSIKNNKRWKAKFPKRLMSLRSQRYRALRIVFAYTMFPSNPIINQLAQKLKVRPEAVQVWFKCQKSVTQAMRTDCTADFGINTSQLEVSDDNLQYEVRYAWNIQEQIEKKGLASIGLPDVLKVDLESLSISIAVGVPLNLIKSALEDHITLRSKPSV